jgi:dTDP-4-amino-4,6-dideoxygalactose transaminase
MQELGYNYRISDILCALGYSQLDRIESNLLRRKSIVKKYNDEFSKIDSIKTYIFDEGHAYHLYIIWVNERKELFDYLHSKHIYAQIHYYPVHLMPYYKKFGYSKGDFVESESYYDGCVSLPIFSGLEDQEQEYVIDQIKLFYTHKSTK